QPIDALVLQPPESLLQVLSYLRHIHRESPTSLLCRFNRAPTHATIFKRAPVVDGMRAGRTLSFSAVRASAASGILNEPSLTHTPLLPRTRKCYAQQPLRGGNF